MLGTCFRWVFLETNDFNDLAQIGQRYDRHIGAIYITACAGPALC